MPDAHYPINFVVKDPAFFQRPALRRWKPADVTGLSPDRRQPFWKSKTDGGDQETANEMVELSGIEPLTSCLQSTRSPN